MTYYLLPKSSPYIHNYIDVIFDDKIPTISLSYSLSNYLTIMKEKIDIHSNEWDTYKKYTNPYEFIHTIIPVK